MPYDILLTISHCWDYFFHISLVIQIWKLSFPYLEVILCETSANPSYIISKETSKHDGGNFDISFGFADLFDEVKNMWEGKQNISFQHILLFLIYENG